MRVAQECRNGDAFVLKKELGATNRPTIKRVSLDYRIRRRENPHPLPPSRRRCACLRVSVCIYRRELVFRDLLKGFSQSIKLASAAVP